MSVRKQVEKMSGNYALNKLMEEDCESAMIMPKIQNPFEVEMIRLEGRLKEQLAALQSHVIIDFQVLKAKWQDAVKAEEAAKEALKKVFFGLLNVLMSHD